MRAYRLAHVAFEAETVRWKSMASRMAVRIAFAAVAVVFILGVLVFVHVGIWEWLRISMGMGIYATTAILGGVDLLIAIVLGVLASRSTPSREEVEALEVRRTALTSMGTTLSISALALPALRMVMSRRRKARA